MNKLIFLDFDGVINHRAWLSGPRSANHDGSYDPFMHAHRSFDPACVARINRIVKVTGARIVISSSWRSHKRGTGGSKTFLAGVLCSLGLRNAQKVIQGITPDLSRPHGESGIYIAVSRWQEISLYLDDHPCDAFCILDDDAMNDAPPDRFIRTDFNTGITEADVDRAISILNGGTH